MSPDDVAAKTEMLRRAKIEEGADAWPRDVLSALLDFAEGRIGSSDILSTISYQRETERKFSAASCVAAFRLAERMARVSPPPPIVFLDIDGVLLTRRAFALPANEALYREAIGLDKEAAGAHRRTIPSRVSFDPTSVALLTRLCERSGAKIVIHSNWRRNVGSKETKNALVANGIPENLFHGDFACSFRRSSEKGHDIIDWLLDHRTVFPERAPPTRTNNIIGKTRERKENDDRGFPYVIIDDEALGSGFFELERRTIRTDMDDGLSPKTYRIALAMLGGTDPEYGADPLAPEILDKVLKAFGGSMIDAVEWLYGPPPEKRCGRRPPNLEGIRKDAEAMRLFGYGYDPDAAAARIAKAFDDALVRIAKETKRRNAPRKRSWKTGDVADF
jgi:hypothetical protein